MKIVKMFLILLLVAGAFVAGRFAKGPAAPSGRRILYYVDPMHPAYKSDKPGIAPDCGMKLEPVYADGGGPVSPPGERKILRYRDPKAPDYTSDKPGVNPETGNDLEPVYPEDGMVQIPLDKQQLIGVRFGTVEYASTARTLRAVGKVAYDETRIARVQTKIEGWIDHVFVDFTGQLVEKGQPLFTLYSPEMLATQQEYLLALRAHETMQGSTMTGMLDYSHSLVEASRRRLELWDLGESQIQQIAERKQALKNVTVYSPMSGYVTARNAYPNQKIMPDTELYTVVDLSKVWVMADVFEYEAADIQMGQPVKITLSAYPSRPFAGRVSYIQPQVDAMTRTLKVRVELDNPEGLLKPEMFADVEFQTNAARRLAVPAEAVLDSGRAKTVFVDRGNGYFEPRVVETGERFGDRLEVRSGLKAGERVVTSGNFLVDSESQLKAAVGGMTTHQH